ncbi:Mitochondrial carrier protein [Nesidiocoris tenuis]|uniref:Mitochondrial carrier protein n=1 Tax=Nesidiocoris tenuis TaxID=355587 RepID=A0ABN7B5Q0_9HEMI|nr:Mitochondrial carrier protein [Nesidiocoris tenuis]
MFSLDHETVRRNREFICGWGAATCNILVTFPINKIIFRQMLHNVSIMAAVKQIASERIVHLYRGVLPPLCQKSISVALMFGVYEKCKTPLLAAHVDPILSTILAAITAGSIECVLLPFERLQTVLQHEK